MINARADVVETWRRSIYKQGEQAKQAVGLQTARPIISLRVAQSATRVKKYALRQITMVPLH